MIYPYIELLHDHEGAYATISIPSPIKWSLSPETEMPKQCIESFVVWIEKIA